MNRLRVRVWNEFRNERVAGSAAARTYPEGIHVTVANALRSDPQLLVATATLDEPENGLAATALAETDVLVWWSHDARDEVPDDVVERVARRVWNGMGLIALHSAHKSKIFNRLMGSSCYLKWREVDHERLWVVDPSHPIAQGLPEVVDIGPEEMYGEHFDVPPPENLVFISWFAGGEVFRSGCCYTRGRGRIFYFRPGHEDFPTLHHPDVQQILRNAVRWAVPTCTAAPLYGHVPARRASEWSTADATAPARID